MCFKAVIGAILLIEYTKISARTGFFLVRWITLVGFNFSLLQLPLSAEKSSHR